MPELPEVENVRRRLQPLLNGQRVTSAWAGSHRNFGPLPDLTGSVVADVSRRGKWLIVELDSTPARERIDLLVHLGMTGALLMNPSPVEVAKHVRMRVTFASGDELVLRDPRGFGRVRAVAHGEYASVPSLAELGPEPLPGVDLSDAVRNLTGRAAAVKGLLLSGKVVAGVGNYLADEALWRAKIHPNRRLLSPAAARKVIAEIVSLVEAAIEAGGSTFRDYRRPDGTSGSAQQLLRCYGRAGLGCDRCGTVLSTCTVAGRTSTFCRRCQRLR